MKAVTRMAGLMIGAMMALLFSACDKKNDSTSVNSAQNDSGSKTEQKESVVPVNKQEDNTSEATNTAQNLENKNSDDSKQQPGIANQDSIADLNINDEPECIYGPPEMFEEIAKTEIAELQKAEPQKESSTKSPHKDDQDANQVINEYKKLDDQWKTMYGMPPRDRPGWSEVTPPK